MRDQGISWTRTHEHSTTAAPYCSSKSLSAGDKTRFAFGLHEVACQSTGTGRGYLGDAVKKYLDLRDDDTMVLLADG
jgi:hypothetical protein